MTQLYYAARGLILALAAQVIACGPKPEADSGLLGLTTSQLWDKTELVVCWDRQRQKAGIPTQNLEAALAAAATAGYTKAATGLVFVGFKDCAGAEDVRIIWDDSGQIPAGGGAANQIGRFDADSQSPEFAGVPGAAVMLSLADTQSITATLRPGLTLEDWAAQVGLHELGHIAGLFHEHAHPASSCKITPESALTKFSDMGPAAEFAYLDRGSRYDPFSIMSYCVMGTVLNGDVQDPALQGQQVRPGLSDGDKNFLLSLYHGADGGIGSGIDNGIDSGIPSDAAGGNGSPSGQAGYPPYNPFEANDPYEPGYPF